MAKSVVDIDKEIITLLQADDDRAMDLLTTHYYKVVLSTVQKIILDRDLAKDVVQELFFNIWSRRHRIKVTTPVIHYLNRAAVNRSLNYKRDQQNPLEILSKDLSRFEENALDLPASSALEAAELQPLIDQGINQLPPKTRATFILSRYELKTYKEIAALMGVSEKTVESRVSSALQYLKAYLNFHGYHVKFWIGFALYLNHMDKLICITLMS